MTPDKTPSEAELDALSKEDGMHSDYAHFMAEFGFLDPYKFARAVLAKWGSPVVAVEPVTKERFSEPLARVINAGYSLANCAFNLAQRPGAEISIGTSQTLSDCQKEWDAACAAHKALPATPQPTKAQAGAVPLTPEQIKDEASHHGFIGSTEMLVNFVRGIEAHHGIKEGGQHAAD